MTLYRCVECTLLRCEGPQERCAECAGKIEEAPKIERPARDDGTGAIR